MASYDPKKKESKSVVRKAFNNLVVTGLITAGGLGVAAGGVYVWDKASQSTDTRTVNQIEEIKTEKCTKVMSTMTTQDSKTQSQQKSYICESTSEFVIYTNDGNYDNSPNRLRFKSEEDVKAIQDQIKVGASYDFNVSGFQMAGKESILGVSPSGSAPVVTPAPATVSEAPVAVAVPDVVVPAAEPTADTAKPDAVKPATPALKP